MRALSFWTTRLWYLDQTYASIPRESTTADGNTSEFIHMGGQLYETLIRNMTLLAATQILNYDPTSGKLMQDEMIRMQIPKLQLLNRLMRTFLSSFVFENVTWDGNNGEVRFYPKNPTASIVSRLPFPIRKLLWETSFMVLPSFEEIDAILLFIHQVSKRNPWVFSKDDMQSLQNYFPKEADELSIIRFPIVLGQDFIAETNRSFQTKHVRHVEATAESWRVRKGFTIDTITTRSWDLVLSPAWTWVISSTVKRIEWIFTPTVWISDGEIERLLWIEHRY